MNVRNYWIFSWFFFYTKLFQICHYVIPYLFLFSLSAFSCDGEGWARNYFDIKQYINDTVLVLWHFYWNSVHLCLLFEMNSFKHITLSNTVIRLSTNCSKNISILMNYYRFKINTFSNIVVYVPSHYFQYFTCFLFQHQSKLDGRVYGVYVVSRENSISNGLYLQYTYIRIHCRLRGTWYCFK